MPTENQETAVTTTTESATNETKVLSSKQQQVLTAMNQVAQGKDDINPFAVVALLLQSMREELEVIKYEGQPPRWMRIARARKYQDSAIGGGVMTITGGFLNVMGILVELTLKAQEILEQIDSGRALLEVGASMIQTAMDDKFLCGVATSVGIKDFSAPDLSGARNAVGIAMDMMKYVPDPEDVKVVAEEMFKLLAIGEWDFVKPAGKLDIPTGKLRILSWALSKPLSCHGITGGEPVSALGISLSGNVNKDKYIICWEKAENIICEVPLTAKPAGSDLYKEEVDEADRLLKRLGYAGATEEAIAAFRTNNSLTETGKLGISTISRLVNLDYENMTLKRAIGATKK